MKDSSIKHSCDGWRVEEELVELKRYLKSSIDMFSSSFNFLKSTLSSSSSQDVEQLSSTINSFSWQSGGVKVGSVEFEALSTSKSSLYDSSNSHNTLGSMFASCPTQKLGKIEELLEFISNELSCFFNLSNRSSIFLSRSSILAISCSNGDKGGGEWKGSKYKGCGSWA